MPNQEELIAKLWNKICNTFATNEEVCRLAHELRKMENMHNAESSLTANAAAALVIKQIRGDLNTLKDDFRHNNFSIEICTQSDKYNRPVVKDPKYNAIYLTLAEKAEHDDMWDEWIAIPRTIGGKESYRWEHLGAKNIDLSWIKTDFHKVNKAIEELQYKLENYSEITKETILNKAIKPLETLRNYINSAEFTKYIYDELPRATLGQDGLMTSNAVALLQGLALWAGNDHKVLGGGAMSADYVIRAMEYYGINCDDLKTNVGGQETIYPEFNFPKN